MKSLVKLMIFIALMIFTTACATTGSSRTTGHHLGQNAPAETTGVVMRFLTTPVGEVDGFILEDETQVRFPVEMSTSVTNSLAIGDAVTVKGYETTENSMWAEKIITPKNANELVMQDEAKGKAAAPKKKREQAFRSLQSMTVSGEIDTLLHEPTSGEVSGFLLTEGSIVRLPPDIRTPMHAYDVGQYVEVMGYGSQNKFGKTVEASTVQRQQSDYEIDYE